MPARLHVIGGMCAGGVAGAEAESFGGDGIGDDNVGGPAAAAGVGAGRASAPSTAEDAAIMAALAQRLDWSRVPSEMRPSSEGRGGLAHLPVRVLRKRWQLESVWSVLQATVRRILNVRQGAGAGAGADAGAGAADDDARAAGAASGRAGTQERTPELGRQPGLLVEERRVATSTSPPTAAPAAALAAPLLHIVDFGSGSGNSALPFAALLQESCRFTLLDLNETSVKLGQVRCVYVCWGHVRGAMVWGGGWCEGVGRGMVRWCDCMGRRMDHARCICTLKVGRTVQLLVSLPKQARSASAFWFWVPAPPCRNHLGAEIQPLFICRRST